MTIEVTDEMRQRLAGALAEGHAVVAASVDEEGQPKLAYYGSAQVHDSMRLPSGCAIPRPASWTASPGTRG